MLFHGSFLVTAKSNSAICFNVIKVCSFIFFFPLFSFSEEPLVLDGFTTSCVGCRKVDAALCETFHSHVAERVNCEEIVTTDIQVARTKNLLLDSQALVSYLVTKRRGEKVSRTAVQYLLGSEEGARAIGSAGRNFFVLYINLVQDSLKTAQGICSFFWEALWAYTREMREEEALRLRAFIIEHSSEVFTLKDYFEEYPVTIEQADLFLEKSERFFFSNHIQEKIAQTRLFLEKCAQNIQIECVEANAPEVSREFLRGLGHFKAENKVSLRKDTSLILFILPLGLIVVSGFFFFQWRRKKNQERVSLEKVLVKNLSYFNLPPKASVSDLERAFKMKAKKVHPDVMGGNTGQFYLLTERYHRAKQLLLTLKVNAK